MEFFTPELPAFNFDAGTFETEAFLPDGFEFDPRFKAPRKERGYFKELTSWTHANKLVDAMEVKKGMREDVLLNGTFIWGDFVEAFIVKHNFHVKEMHVSTLSMSIENAVSLRNLFTGGYVDRLVLVVSNRFWYDARNTTIKFLLEELSDFDFQLAVCRSHVKMLSFETHAGGKVVMHGSANLRTSGCIENMCIEESPAMYDRFAVVWRNIAELYGILNEDVNAKPLKSGKVREKFNKGLHPGMNEAQLWGCIEKK